MDRLVLSIMMATIIFVLLMLAISNHTSAENQMNNAHDCYKLNATMCMTQNTTIQVCILSNKGNQIICLFLCQQKENNFEIILKDEQPQQCQYLTTESANATTDLTTKPATAVTEFITRPVNTSSTVAIASSISAIIIVVILSILIVTMAGLFLKYKTRAIRNRHTSDKKRSTFEEAALTVNPSYGVHPQLKRNNNDNPTNEESHHREPVQLELQEEIIETRNLSAAENLEYYATISEY